MSRSYIFFTNKLLDFTQSWEIRFLFDFIADLFLYSYKAEIMRGLLQRKQKKIAKPFNDTFLYTDGAQSINIHQLLIQIVSSNQAHGEMDSI